jgi:hypothetical protein
MKKKTGVSFKADFVDLTDELESPPGATCAPSWQSKLPGKLGHIRRAVQASRKLDEIRASAAERLVVGAKGG